MKILFDSLFQFLGRFFFPTTIYARKVSFIWIYIFLFRLGFEFGFGINRFHKLVFYLGFNDVFFSHVSKVQNRAIQNKNLQLDLIGWWQLHTPNIHTSINKNDQCQFRKVNFTYRWMRFILKMKCTKLHIRVLWSQIKL